MIRSLLPVAVALAAVCARAQVPYTETFGTADRGIAGDCAPYGAPSDCATNDFSGVGWTITGDVSGLTAASDFFLTSGGALVGQDLDEELCWNSPQLTASGSVEIQVDLSETGDLEGADYVDVGYSVDGGPYTFVPNVTGGGSQTVNDDFASLTVTSPTLTPSSTLDVRVCAVNNAGAESHLIEEVRVAAPSGQSVTLAVSPADGGSIEEAAAGSPRATSFDVTLTASDGEVTEAEVTVELNLVVGTNGGDFTPTVDGGGVMAPIVLTFPAGTASGTAKDVEVTAEDDAESEGSEAFQFALENPSGATVSGDGTFDFTILDDDEVAATDVRINEVRIGQVGADDDEYVEIAGTPGSLDGLSYLVIGDIGENAGVIEEVTPLDGSSIPADGYFLIAQSTFSLGPTPDLVTVLSFEDENVTHLLVEGFSGDFGDDLDADDDGALDSMPWTSVVDAVGFVESPVGGDPYYGELLGFDDVGPDGTAVPGHLYRNESTGTYQIGLLDADDATAEDTPGVSNLPPVGQSGFADLAGYRLLGFPIGTGTGSDLAELNLVQGVPGQYETADPNVFVDYDGAGYIGMTSTATDIPSGQGFFLYVFDVDFDPPNTAAGGGTSRSFDLGMFDLSVSGTSPTMDVPYTAPTLNGTAAEDGAYMIGNPFPAPLDLFGISMAGDGMLSTTFLAWDPVADDFDALDGSVDDGSFLDVWQGVIATVDYGTDPTTGPTFTFASSEIDPAEGGTFPGRRSEPLALGLDLTGTTASGATVRDGLADLWFREGASLGPDRVDAIELAPPAGVRARLALVDDGQRRSVRGVPLAIDGGFDTPVSFRTTEAGTFTITFDPDAQLPEGLSATLTDRVSGLSYAPGDEVTFAAEASDWTERFTLSVTGTAVATDGPAEAVLAVGEVFPNPAAGSARLALEVDAAQRVTVTVYDAIGRAVGTVQDGDLAPGAPVTVDLPDGLAPGAYVVRVMGETFAETRRMVVVR